MKAKSLEIRSIVCQIRTVNLECVLRVSYALTLDF